MSNVKGVQVALLGFVQQNYLLLVCVLVSLTEEYTECRFILTINVRRKCRDSIWCQLVECVCLIWVLLNTGFTVISLTCFILQGEKAAKTEKTDDEKKVSFNGSGTGSQPATILGRQLKPGLLPMVPELAKQTRSDMMNSVVAPIALVKQEPQV